jgi:hypothetical protein
MIDHEARNPYAPPQALRAGNGKDLCWRAGKMLVVPTGSSLPHRCVKCNAPARMDKPRTYRWHSAGFEFAIGLCDSHRKRRLGAQVTVGGLLATGFLCLAGAAMAQRVELANTAGVLLLLALILKPLTATLRPIRLDAAQAQFSGCGETFLDSLPAERLHQS